MKRKTGKGKKVFLIIFLIILVLGFFDICITEIKAKNIPHRFASVKEGCEIVLSNTEYYSKYSQNDIDFRMKKSGATIDEFMNASADLIKKFSLFEKISIDHRISKMYRTLKKNDLIVPEIDEIVFVKMKMDLEGGCSGYTQGTKIYLDSTLVTVYSLLDLIFGTPDYMDELLWHEMFHCITRNNPDFKSKMYSLINFTVVESDYQLPPCLQNKILTNPDVEHHNSYATFQIDGQKIDCFVAWITTKDFAEVMSGWNSCEAVALVPIDGTDTYYLSEQASNFDEIFGTNTTYVIDPEECMADNFAFAMLYGIKGKNSQGYSNPEIIQGILDVLNRNSK